MEDLKLTDDQSAAIDLIGKFLSSDKLSMGITGSAGTGKTTLIGTALKNIGSAGVAAPTHKAKNKIKQATNTTAAYTVAELIGLGVDEDVTNFNPNLPKFAPKFEPKLQIHKRYFIDEASMINSELTAYLKNLARDFNTQLIFIGDNCQLPPVGEANDSVALTENDFSIELQTIVRQSMDSPLTALLLALRCDILYLSHGEVDSKTLTALKNACEKFDIEIPDTNGRAFGSLIRTCDEGVTNDKGEGWSVVKAQDTLENQLLTYVKEKTNFKALCYTNVRTADYNKYIRTMEFGAGVAPIVKHDRLMAYASVRNSDGRTYKIMNSAEYKVLSAGPGLITLHNTRLETFQTTLLDIENGSTAFMDILSPTSYEAFNTLMTKLYHKAKDSGWGDYYKVKNGAASLIDHCIVYGNYALPYKTFDYANCMTTHKSQGSTYDRVVVDGTNIASVKYSAKDYDATGKEIYMRKLLYVAISRAKTHATIYFKS